MSEESIIIPMSISEEFRAEVKQLMATGTYDDLMKVAEDATLKVVSRRLQSYIGRFEKFNDETDLGYMIFLLKADLNQLS